MNLFDMNGQLMNALRKLSCIFLCNVMFCLLSLPLFTIGASLAALYTCMQAVIHDDEEDVIIRQFWKAFRSNFKQATAIWLICAAACAFMSLFYLLISRSTGAVSVIYRVSFFFFCFLLLMGYQYIFPMQARYVNKIRHTIKNAYLLSIAALPWTVLSILLTAGAVYLTFFMNPNGFHLAIFLWGTLGFGIVAYLNCFFFDRAFQMIDPKKQIFEKKPAEGAIFVDEEHRVGDLPEVSEGYSNPYWNQRTFGKTQNKETDPENRKS